MFVEKTGEKQTDKNQNILRTLKSEKLKKLQNKSEFNKNIKWAPEKTNKTAQKSELIWIKQNTKIRI